MERKEAITLARRLLDQHGLHDWHISLDRARCRAGACHYQKRAITLSGTLVDLYSFAQVKDVILHEVAHALVGEKHGHDAVWKKMAVRVGANPQRLLPRDRPTVSAPWIGTCSKGHTVQRFRRPSRVLACRICSRTFSLDTVFSWTYQGEPTQPGGAYSRELTQLKQKLSLYGRAKTLLHR